MKMLLASTLIAAIAALPAGANTTYSPLPQSKPDRLPYSTDAQTKPWLNDCVRPWFRDGVLTCGEINGQDGTDNAGSRGGDDPGEGNGCY